MIKFIETRKNYIMALAILFVIISLSGTTYSLFIKSDSTNTFNYNTGLLELEFTEDKPLTLESAFPVNDSEGIKTEPYTLTIKNTGNLTYLFDLKMLSENNENTIDSKYIKVKVNDKLPHTLFTTNNQIASNIIIYPGEEITFKINIWLDIDTPNKELGNTFKAKIVTTGTSIYKTLDSSGANHPKIKDTMIPVYYDEQNKTWKKADNSNTIENYEWYNYDEQKWANTVIINNTDRKIYDITNKNHLTIDNLITNNGNIVIEDKYLELGMSNYSYNNISQIFRIKIDEFINDKTYIITNNKIAFYYDQSSNKLIFKNGENQVSSSPINLDEDTWYILGYTYNGNKIKFYVDGNKVSEANLPGTINSNNSFKLGTDDTNKEISNIIVGDIYTYNSILTDSEINTNYKTNINIIYHNLVSGYNEFTTMTKEEYYLSLPIGSTINNEDIKMYYVWIPRFKYKLWNVSGENNIDSYNAYNKGIDIIFEKSNTSSGVIYCQDNECYTDQLKITKVTKNDNGKYYTHPAFKTNEAEVTGLWVSKYEISTDNTNCSETNNQECQSNELNITSKPNKHVWTNNYLSNFYQNIKKIDNNINYHMIKNSEWGAIAYLSHSKYGLCQNDKCKEIGINNTYISGYNSSDSTTNNIYGVFDMAGSATEFTMSNYTDEPNKLSLTNSKFTNTQINNSDYDLYFNNTFILGDATKELNLETNSWYNNNNIFIDSTNNWFIRGGIANQPNSGIFSYSATTDNSSEYITTRIVTK